MPVEPGYSAIVTTVDLFLHLNITRSTEKYGSIFSKTLQKPSFLASGIISSTRSSQSDMNYILAAIHTVENYVQSFEIPLRYYHIELTSELDSPTGKNWLSSSGAVTVGLVRTLRFYGLEAPDLLVYKLSVLAHYN